MLICGYTGILKYQLTAIASIHSIRQQKAQGKSLSLSFLWYPAKKQPGTTAPHVSGLVIP